MSSSSFLFHWFLQEKSLLFVWSYWVGVLKVYLIGDKFVLQDIYRFTCAYIFFQKIIKNYTVICFETQCKNIHTLPKHRTVFWRYLLYIISFGICSTPKLCSTFLFHITSVVIPEQEPPDHKNFIWISASAVDAASVNSNSIKTLLANDVSTFFINGKPTFVNGLRNLSINII